MGEILPELGAVFWPVGTGDSSTVVVSEEMLIQVDLHDMAKADDDDTHEIPVRELLARVTIGELWATPRLWREFAQPDAPELCKDAQAFQEESVRRVEATK